jgi:hypothetical protein
VVTDPQEKEAVEFASVCGSPLSNGGMPESTDSGTDSYRRYYKSKRTEEATNRRTTIPNRMNVRAGDNYHFFFLFCCAGGNRSTNMTVTMGW